MIGSDKKHLLTPVPRDRSIVDSAGIIPFPIGAFQSPTPDNSALFIETPIFRHDPCKVNMKTGKWANHVGKSLAKVSKAMKECKIYMCDAILTLHDDTEVTPLSQILEKVQKYEELIVDKILAEKESITNHNSIIRAEIVAILRRYNSPALKLKLRAILKSATDNRRMSMTSLPIENYGGLQNESFNGLDQFEAFYNRHIATDAHKEELKAVFKSQEGLNVDSFVAVSRAFHMYYDVFLHANELKPGGHPVGRQLSKQKSEKDIAAAEADAFSYKSFGSASSDFKNEISWMRIIRPLVKGRVCIDNTQHQNDSKEIISKFIWLLLIERFETLSSVLHTFFKTYAGVGSDVLGECISKMANMIILSSFSPLFEAKAVNFTPEELAAETFDASDRKSVLCKEISGFDAAFEKEFPLYLSSIKLPNYAELDRKSERWIQLTKTLSSNLVEMQYPMDLHDHLVLRDLSIDLVAKDLVKKNLTESFQTTKKVLNLWNEGVKDTLEINEYIPNHQRDRLFAHICSRMKEYVRGHQAGSPTSATAKETLIDVEKAFLAKIVLTLNHGDSIFHSVFHIPDITDRQKLSPSLLSKIYNPLSLGKSASDSVEKESVTLSQDALTYLDYVLKPGLTWRDLFTHIDIFSDMYKLDLSKLTFLKKKVVQVLTDEKVATKAQPASRSQSAKTSKPKQQQKKKPQQQKPKPGKNNNNKGKKAGAKN